MKSVAAGLFALGLCVYTSTLAPGFVFADTGELALVAATGGVAHPPGFPLYLVLAGWWSGLPLGSDVAWRLNLLSAVFGALALPALYLALREATRRPGRSGWQREIPGVCAALLFGFSYTFWRQATITEVYTLNLLMASLLLLLTVGYLRRTRAHATSVRHAAAIGLVAGLGVANHLSLGLALFGIAAVVILAPRTSERARIRDVAVGGASFAVGLLLYAVLPLRAAHDPLFAWGDPRDLASLWRHASGWQFQGNFHPTFETLAKQLRAFGASSTGEVGVLPLVLIPLGLWRLWRADAVLFAGLALACLVPTGYALGYDIAEDQNTYLLIPYLVAALWMGFGADALLGLASLARRPTLRAGSAVALLCLALSPLALNYARADRSAETEARDYALDVLEGVQRDAIVLTRFWNLYAPTLYLQHLEQVRRDVDLVDLNLLQYTWYLDYLERVSPRVFSGQEERLLRHRVLHARWERDPHALSAAERREAVTLLEALVDGVVREGWRHGRAVYATFETAVEIEPRFRKDPQQPFLAAPEALPLRLLPERHPFAHPLPPVAFRNRFERRSSDEVAMLVRNRYEEFWLQRGRWYESRQQRDAAIEAYRQAEAIPPGSDAARRALGRLSSTRAGRAALGTPRATPGS